MFKWLYNWVASYTIFLMNFLMIVLCEDIENIDNRPKEDLAKSGYKPHKMYNSLIDLVSRRLILQNLTL
jgi:hypothetical protein